MARVCRGYISCAATRRQTSRISCKDFIPCEQDAVPPRDPRDPGRGAIHVAQIHISATIRHVDMFARESGGIPANHTRDIHPLLDQCWASVYDAGPTLIQQWDSDASLAACRGVPPLRRDAGFLKRLVFSKIRQKKIEHRRLNSRYNTATRQDWDGEFFREISLFLPSQ